MGCALRVSCLHAWEGEPYKTVQLEKHKQSLNGKKKRERDKVIRAQKERGSLQRCLKSRKQVDFRSLEGVQTGSH